MTSQDTQAGSADPAPSPRDYPEHWEADVLLRDGRTAHLRPILPEDAEGLVEFYSHVSQESKYFRFFAPMPTLSDHDVKRFTNVDYHDRVALVMTVAERIIAVGRYDVVEKETNHSRAEVAFLVQDAHQGRGIAQLLLEHLAQAGRERGVDRFVAEVLPNNRRMMQVFREQGYEVKGGWDEGVMHLEFDIDPTDTSIGVLAAREHRSEAASIAAFLERAEHRRHRGLAAQRHHRGTAGAQPGAGWLHRPGLRGEPCRRRGGRDAVVPHGGRHPRRRRRRDRRGAGRVRAGRGAGLRRQGGPRTRGDLQRFRRDRRGRAQAAAQAGRSGSRSYGLRLIGPNCLGVINTARDVSLNASLSPVMPPRGRAGFFCQSGALGSAILEKVRGRGLGLSTFVSAGNRADVSGNDLLQYWEEDEATEVILLYLESIGNPRKFSRIARRVSHAKPIIAVRSGRTTQGVPMGHAVRQIAAPPEAVDAMFRQAGIIQVDTLDEMFDVAQLLAHQPLPDGSRVAIVGNSDALGLLAVDAATASGLTVTSAMALGADATAEDFEDALDAAIDDDHVDAVVAVYIPALDAGGEEVANVLAAVGEQSDKPLVSSFLGREGVPELLRVPDLAGHTAGRGSVPSYPAVEAAVRALGRVVEYAAWRQRYDESVVVLDKIDMEPAERLVKRLLIDNQEGRDLSDAELRTLLACYGIDLWEREHVSTVEEALEAGEKLGWNVVLKATAERLRDRPDQAHVWRNIDDESEMREAWDSLMGIISHPADAEFVVQRMAAPGVPVAISSLEDPLFGPAVSFGVSGALTELVGDRAFRIPPISALDAAETVRSIKAAPLLFGYRGSEQVDVPAVEDLIRRVAQLKIDLPQVSKLDLLLVHATPDGVNVLHATGRVEPIVEPRSDLLVRRLSTPPGGTWPG